MKFGEYELNALGDVNFILGKNGVGKSQLLRALDRFTRDQGPEMPSKYIVPERAGQLIWAPHVENQVTSDVNFLRNSRMQNQVTEFRQQVMVTYRRLELAILRKFEISQKVEDKFEPVIEQINGLLDYVQIVRTSADFDVRSKVSGQVLDRNQISSGESELISLGIECLEFAYSSDPTKARLLILDEPDVHLHPDLQTRLAEFLVNISVKHKIRIVLASHSTALIGAFQLAKTDLRLAFMSRSQKIMTFRPVDDLLRRVLPVFGAHPLSNIFNEAPPMLVEGEDDERIWQQAVRRTKGAIRIYPCEVSGVGAMDEYENRMDEIIAAVYDDGVAYSLRDGDDSATGDPVDKGSVVRLRLACRDPENLILTDEVLASLGTGWNILQQSIEKWLLSNPAHAHFAAMQGFKASGYDRRYGDVKDIRNDLMGLIGASRPWEVAVGAAIGDLANKPPNTTNPNSMWVYLGSKICKSLIP